MFEKKTVYVCPECERVHNENVVVCTRHYGATSELPRLQAVEITRVAPDDREHMKFGVVSLYSDDGEYVVEAPFIFKHDEAERLAQHVVEFRSDQTFSPNVIIVERLRS